MLCCLLRESSLIDRVLLFLTFAKTMASEKQPLISNQNSPPKICLYDEECTLDIDIDKARGLLVLLQSKDLAFAALTDGNIIDACLGAPPLRRDGERYLRTRDAKNALAVASDTSESIPELAVTTYKKGLDIVVQHHEKIKKILFCCRCFLQGRIRRKAKAELKETFKMLQEAVEASSF